MKKVFLIIGLLILLFFLDYLNVWLLKGVPIISVKVVSSENVKTYNSIFYRVYDCDGTLTLDNFYQKDYVCKDSDIDKIYVTEFLDDSKTSFKNYKNKFVHLIGKINTVTGDSSITLEAYEDTGELNGYAKFDETKKVQIDNLKIDPTKYHIYDFFEVIARVDSYKESDKNFIIYLKDAKIIDNNIYNNYELEVENTTSFTKDLVIDNIYYVGIKSILYKYTSDAIYSLDYLLLDKRETIENITKDKEYKITGENDKLYELDNYNLLLCENNDIVFMSKYIYSNNNYCQNEN